MADAPAQTSTAAASHDRSAGAGDGGVDTRFLPVRATVLARAIERDVEMFGAIASRAVELARAFDAVIDQEVTAFHELIDERYESLNPDADTGMVHASPDEENRRERELLAALRYTLDKANFETLGDVELESAIAAGCSYGLRVRVDPARVQHLGLHVRGRARTPVARRHRWRLWETVEQDVEVYQRLVVVARLTGEPGVRLKLFRDIPVRDVEALLPHAEVRMSFLDRVAVFGAGAGALSGAAAKAFTLVTGGVVALTQLVWAVLAGLAGLSFKAFFGYRRKKSMRTSQRTRHLYEKNLANNAAVLHSVLRMIHQEELKEVLLAYCALAAWDGSPPGDAEVDRWIEAWIEARFGVCINFDMSDAVETLTRLGLWRNRGACRVLPSDETIGRLDDRWRGRCGVRYHRDAAARAMATGGLEPPT